MLQLQSAPRPARTANNFKSRKYEPIDKNDAWPELAAVWLKRTLRVE